MQQGGIWCRTFGKSPLNRCQTYHPVGLAIQSPYLETFHGAPKTIPSLDGRYDNPIVVPACQAGGVESSESIPGLLKRLQIKPTKLHRLAESIPRHRFLGSLNVYKYGLCRGDAALPAACATARLSSLLSVMYVEKGPVAAYS